MRCLRDHFEIADISVIISRQHPAEHQTLLAFVIWPTYVLGMIADFIPTLLDRAWERALPGREAAEQNAVLRALLAAAQDPRPPHALAPWGPSSAQLAARIALAASYGLPEGRFG